MCLHLVRGCREVTWQTPALQSLFMASDNKGTKWIEKVESNFKIEMFKARQMRMIHPCCSSGAGVSRQDLLLGDKARRPLTPQDPAPKPQPIIAQSTDAHGVGSQALEQTALVCCQLVQGSSRWDGAALWGNGNFALHRKCRQLSPVAFS